MNLNDLFRKQGIDPQTIIVMRHRPFEPELRQVLPWLAAEKPELFNAYQQTQGRSLERAMLKLLGKGTVASFIGQEPGSAIFVGLYRIESAQPLNYEQYCKIETIRELRKLGMQGWVPERDARETIQWFDLMRTSFYADWEGRLKVGWPPPERSWWRRAHRNEFPVVAIHEDNVFSAKMPNWEELQFTWAELQVLPKRWQAALAQWRGIYYIFDKSDCKGYVGSAYGEANLLGRWLNYAASGHGGNSELRKRTPTDFSFTILQRVSPDMDATDVIGLESSWKMRLHTRRPHGLNDN